MSPRTGRPKTGNAREVKVDTRLSEEEVKNLDYCCKVLDITRAEVIRIGIKDVYEAAKSMEHWTGLEDFKKHLHSKKK